MVVQLERIAVWSFLVVLVVLVGSTEASAQAVPVDNADAVEVAAEATETSDHPAAADAEAVSEQTSPQLDETPAQAVSATAEVVSPSVAGPLPVVAVPAPDERAGAVQDARPVEVTESSSTTTSPSPGDAAARPVSGAQPAGVTFSGIPAVNYIADNGLGVGLIAAAYFHDGATAPYRTAITLQLFVTAKLVQDHNVIIDSLRVLNLPLRLNARLGYISSLSQNYCGLGGSVTCDPAVAADAAVAAGLEQGTTGFDDFTRRFYQRRFMNPYGLVNLRYALVERSPGQPTRVELTGGYRAFYFVPGDVFADENGDGQPDLTPFPGSLYARDFPDGEPGLSSVLTAGLMLDSRNAEPSPQSGWWNELSVRASTPGLSTWSFGGFNVTLRGFTSVPMTLPLYGNTGRRIVLANRFTFDGIVGQPPIQELARLGGSQDVYAFGGADIGRGIRVQRYLGKLKALNQSEVRFRFAETELLSQHFAFTLAGFIDAGIIGDELVAPKDVGVAAGGGGALRIAWNENFIIRIDIAVSPVEQWAIQPYVTINQPF